jgi:hypothetical protein
VNENKLDREIIEPGISSELYSIDFFDSNFLICNGYIDSQSYIKIWDYNQNTLNSFIRTSKVWDISSNKTIKKACAGLRRNLLLFDLSNLIISVSEHVESIVIISPNPNSSLTSINLNITEAEKVDINIVNQEGIEIGKVYSGLLEIGKHRFAWDGSYYPSGVYYCKIRGKNINKTLKIILEK